MQMRVAMTTVDNVQAKQDSNTQTAAEKSIRQGSKENETMSNVLIL